MTLVAISLDVLRSGQAPSGAFVACPTYPSYQYAWLRDGSFCAYALARRGDDAAATRFHRFVAGAVLRRPDRVAAATTAALTWAVQETTATRDRVVARTMAAESMAAGSGRTPRDTAVHSGGPGRLMLPTRFTLDGDEEPADSDWPNFQLDGYGAWLWTVADHARRGGVLPAEVVEAAGLVDGYLRAAGGLPCFDCWEEYGDRRHTATVAAALAGLRAARDLLGTPPEPDWHLSTVEGSLVKFDGSTRVDASLLWTALPFGLLAVDDPVMVTTAARIEQELVGPGGGVRRYLGDTFYGGGDWILLTAWLGWYRAARGDLAGAIAARSWVEAHATAGGLLPEQVTGAPQDAGMVDPWIRRWGPVATPLLWSHAMYLVLSDAIDEATR